MHGASVAAVLSAVACALVAAALAADWTTRPPAGFAGVWILDHDLGAPGVSAMDADQVHTVLGMRVVIAEGESRFGAEACRHPRYDVTSQEKEEFLRSFKITSAQLPLPGAKIRTLDVQCEERPFNQLFLLDDGTVLYVRDGRFFSAKRSRPSHERDRRRHAPAKRRP